MNKINIQQTGGFPLETDDLDYMQNAYSLFNFLGAIAGNFTIINGCVDNGTSVSNGVVYINGELLEFRGGAKSAYVRITEEIGAKNFETINDVSIYKTRYVEFGAGVLGNQWAWSSFKRILSNKELEGRMLPPGTNPQLFCGTVAQIPQGWHLCDGQNGTPDLRDRFILGVNTFNEIGGTGGANTVTPTGSMSNSEVSVTISNTGWGASPGGPSPNNNIASGKLVVGSGQNENAESLESLRASTMSKTVTSSHNHELTMQQQDNRPKHYKLAYIIFTGNG